MQARVEAGHRRARERHVSKSEAEAVDDRGETVPGHVLHEELNRLPDRYRLPLVHCYLEGKTNEEAAAQLRCPIGTVKGRLWRARSHLRERLARHGKIPAKLTWKAADSQRPRPFPP